MNLNEQIDTWIRVKADLSGACHLNRLSWLDKIAKHGGPAAEAMIPFLESEQSVFGPRDAAYVIYDVQLEHCDLEGAPAMAALTRAAAHHSDAAVREDASRFIERLRSIPARHARCEATGLK